MVKLLVYYNLPHLLSGYKAVSHESLKRTSQIIVICDRFSSVKRNNKINYIISLLAFMFVLILNQSSFLKGELR